VIDIDSRQARTLPPFGAVTRWLMIFNRAAQI
jgi:hypothetical protein